MRRIPSRTSSASFPEFGVVPEGLFPVKLQGPPTVTSSQPAGSLAAFALIVACTKHGVPYRASGHQYATFHVKHYVWAISTAATAPRDNRRNRFDPTRSIHKTSALRHKPLLCVSSGVSRETDFFKLWLTSKLGHRQMNKLRNHLFNRAGVVKAYFAFHVKRLKIDTPNAR